MLLGLSAVAGKVRVVKSRLRGGERVSSFEYGMPMGKERLGSSIPDSWPLLGSKMLSITL